MKTFPTFPVHAQSAILRIWYEAHGFVSAVALRSKPIVLRFKHWISEMFTSGDVSLHSIVIFFSYEPFETYEILLWITEDDMRFL